MAGDKAMTVEISYGTLAENYVYCTGHWDKRMNWHDGPFDPCGLMVQNNPKSKKISHVKQES